MIIDGLDKTIQLKVVLHGPGMSGKTTFLKSILRKFGKKVFSTESTVKRTLNCDYGVISMPFNNWTLKVHLYSTAGARYYEITRPVILSACDGLIFIVDSQKNELKNNIIAWNELLKYFKSELKKLPKIIAFNKDDLSYKFNKNLFLDQIESRSLEHLSCIDTQATKAKGTFEALETLLDSILKSCNVLDFISEMWSIH